MRKRVLIVEDEIFVALELEQAVQSADFDVVAIAADSPSALDSADQCDIALVDLNLRDGPTGPSIGVALATQYGVRVIYVTANPTQIGEAAAAAMGVIVKPFRAQCVQAALRLAASEKMESCDADITGFTLFPPPRGSTIGMESRG